MNIVLGISGIILSDLIYIQLQFKTESGKNGEEIIFEKIMLKMFKIWWKI